MPDIIEPETLAEQFIDLGIDSNIEVRDQNILLKHISASSRNIKNASTTWVYNSYCNHNYQSAMIKW